MTAQTRPELIVITDDTSRSDIEEAISNLVATARRMPDHWVDRRAALHAKIDALLEDWNNVDH